MLILSFLMQVLGLALMVSCQKPAEPVTTTTTTTEEPPAPPVDSDVSTRPPLTGIPQIDYIWDPNLPRELNGYNMSDYPFLRSIPKEIEFKCDGLHDGFYASIPLKCQVIPWILMHKSFQTPLGIDRDDNAK